MGCYSSTGDWLILLADLNRKLGLGVVDPSTLLDSNSKTTLLPVGYSYLIIKIFEDCLFHAFFMNLIMLMDVAQLRLKTSFSQISGAGRVQVQLMTANAQIYIVITYHHISNTST